MEIRSLSPVSYSFQRKPYKRLPAYIPIKDAPQFGKNNKLLGIALAICGVLGIPVSIFAGVQQVQSSLKAPIQRQAVTFTNFAAGAMEEDLRLLRQDLGAIAIKHREPIKTDVTTSVRDVRQEAIAVFRSVREHAKEDPKSENSMRTLGGLLSQLTDNDLQRLEASLIRNMENPTEGISLFIDDLNATLQYRMDNTHIKSEKFQELVQNAMDDIKSSIMKSIVLTGIGVSGSLAMCLLGMVIYLRSQPERRVVPC